MTPNIVLLIAVALLLLDNIWQRYNRICLEKEHDNVKHELTRRIQIIRSLRQWRRG